MRQRARLDANQAAIIDALEALAWGVKSMAKVGAGFPDLIAVKGGRTVYIEVKDGDKSPSRRQLTEDEVAVHGWFKRYGVHVHTVTCVADLAQLDREARAKHEL